MDLEIREELGGRVRVVVFNRPAKRNALTVAMYAAANEALIAAEDARQVRAVIVTGAEGTFTAGNDLRDFVAEPPIGEASPVVQFLTTLARFSKPLLAAVAGAAVGIGTTMLLHCDLVLAAPSARFHLPFTSLGLCPEGGSTLLLPKLVGPLRAAELLLWGEPFDAAAAHRMGLVNEVVPEAELAARALARAERLLELPPDALAATKALLRRPYQQALAESMSREATTFRERLGSAEAAEAFTAFFEKRKPRFG